MTEETKQLLGLDEIFAVAVQMEASAAAYYRRAAQLQREHRHAHFLERLASTEEGHQRIFERFRSMAAASRRGAGEPELRPEGAVVQATIAAGLAVEGSGAAREALTGEETLAEILDEAVGLERAAVQLYTDLRLILTREEDRQVLAGIISEEQDHADALAAQRDALES